ncbi:SH3 domain protein [Ostertagia ostertagi]
MMKEEICMYCNARIKRKRHDDPTRLFANAGKNQRIKQRAMTIVGKGYPGWCIARNSLGQRGLIPENYTKPVIDIMEHQHSEIEEMTEEIEALYHRLHKAQEEIGTLLRGGPTDSDVTNDTETGRLRFYQEF